MSKEEKNNQSKDAKISVPCLEVSGEDFIEVLKAKQDD